MALAQEGESGVVVVDDGHHESISTLGDGSVKGER